MPTINIKRDLLFKALGQTYTEEEFADLCFDYGLELDEVTTEKLMIEKEQGTEKSSGACEEIIYRIEIPANRYDLLCLEGLVRALLIFQKRIKIPKYEALPPVSGFEIIATKETQKIRPYVVAAILRNVKLDKDRYDSFIDLQDKLHQNICRKRDLVSIGTHDLDTLKGPFIYTAKKPEDIKFIPLNKNIEYSADKLMELYSTDSHLKPYLSIIRDLPLYPVIYDSRNTILSLPPIINSNHSKITLDTKNIFIEVTAKDLKKATIVLDVIVTMFSEYCLKPFTVESVKVTNEHLNETKLYPELKYREKEMDLNYVNGVLGIKIENENVRDYLTKMGFTSEQINNSLIKTIIPPTRHDILHVCDLVEDVGIAFGYNKIPETFPDAFTIAEQSKISKLTDQLRHELANCGYTEGLSFVLCSKEDISEKLLKKYDKKNTVEISNPKTIDFQVARTTLIPGLLKTLSSNKKMPLPLKLFEISDVVLINEKSESGALNERRLCAIYYGKTSGFELIHGLLDRIMQVLAIPYSKEKNNKGYYILKCNDETFLEKRCAKIIINGTSYGKFGVLHPQVILNYGLNQPCSLIEMTIRQPVYY